MAVPCFYSFSATKEIFVKFPYCHRQGMIIFLDLSDNEHEVGSVEVKVEGVYIWPFRKLRVVAYRYTY